jgi:phospholipase C
LPAVAYIVPSGLSEHPPSNSIGQKFISIDSALMQSEAGISRPFWSPMTTGVAGTIVPPPQVDSMATASGCRIFGRAYARRGYIDHTTLDYTSILRFIEDNFDVPPLAERDARQPRRVDFRSRRVNRTSSRWNVSKV